MPAFIVTYLIETPSRAVLTGVLEVFELHACTARDNAARALSQKGAVTITNVNQVR